MGDVLEKGHEAGKWTMDFNAAKEYAKKNKKPILLNFTGSDWCGYCIRMEKTVFSTQTWKDFASKNLTQIFVDFPKRKTLPANIMAQNKALGAKYQVRGYPTFILLSADGATLGKVNLAATPEAFIKSIATVISEPTKAKKGVDDAMVAATIKTMDAFCKSPNEKTAITALKAFKAVVSEDPVMFVALKAQTAVELVPWLNSKDLNTLSVLIQSTTAAGTPTDTFYNALAKAAEKSKSSVTLSYKYMVFYSRLKKNDEAMALRPELKKLKAVSSLQEASPWLALLKQISTEDYLQLSFAIQQKDIPMKDKIKMAEQIAALCSRADKAFMIDWFKHITKSPELVEAVKKTVQKQVTSALKSKDYKSRTVTLASNLRIINEFSKVAVDPALARVALRHWQLEYANACSRYQQPVRPKRVGRNMVPGEPLNIRFTSLVKEVPSDRTLSGVNKNEKDLFDFQLAVSHVKTGIYNEGNIKKLLSYKDIYPETVKTYCNDFCGDWAKKVNPNQMMQQPQRYYGYYRPEPSGIPLTRSKQVRNIQQCSDFFKLFQDAGMILKSSTQIKAFSSCFSTGEIISEKEIRSAFPDLTSLTDDMMVELCGHISAQIKQNWANQKQQQKIQKQYRTNRTEEQVKSEIINAYDGIINIIGERMKTSPRHFNLKGRLAATQFDQAEFKFANKLCEMREYTSLQDAAFKNFKECVDIYQQVLEKDKIAYTVKPYIYWLSSILGASDLNALEVSKNPAESQIADFAKVFTSMNSKWREAHIELFAKWAGDMWQGLKPHVKLGFLNSVREILGDHPQIDKINKQLQLYDDLLTEISLRLKVDGPTNVGHNSEFGLFVSLKHSAQLEREAGGFNKYVQNQVRLAGLPTPVDYRKNFAANIRKSLAKKFEIAGIQWLEAGVHSQPSSDEGWRETPLCYVTLKVVDATVDKIPSMQVDIDFNDGAGKVVLPVLSNEVLIDASSAKFVNRPFTEGKLELILDDRGAKDGKIKLEVKMTGSGVLPAIKSILKSTSSYSFDEKFEQSSVVIRVDQDGDTLKPICELTADIPLIWQGGQGKAEKFVFPDVISEGLEVSYKRYSDADIVASQKETYIGAPKSSSKMLYILIVAACLIVIFVTVLLKTDKKQDVVKLKSNRFKTPASINAVSVLSLLEQIRQSDIADISLDLLKEDIQKIEKAFFAAGNTADVDLDSIAQNWLAKAN